MKQKLINHESNLERGAVLRCKGYPPYEECVDSMLVERLTDRGIRYSLMVISGYKAGLTFAQLPDESLPLGD
jgi:hypothetical protein